MMFFWIISFLILKTVVCNDILGCGGYVKSDVEIDFSQVGIKLLTQQGNFKYKTECAPNNGYYFIPLYDKGDYILKVAPPPGWSFDPDEVSLSVDGESDACSRGVDVNFHFKGFAVIGKVVSLGKDSGPAGIKVDLKQGTKIILSTTTIEDGNYVFTPLASGNYQLVASHPTWSFLVDKIDVSVSDQNGDAGNALIISGYQVTGMITANGKPYSKANIILLSKEKYTHKLGCLSGHPEGFSIEGEYKAVCYTISKNGAYSFSSVPPGSYMVVPFMRTNYGTYDIAPSQLYVTVGHSDAQVQEPFKVIGSSLSGRVLSAEGGGEGGMEGAFVTLDDGASAVTNANGEYVFHRVKSGKHVLRVTADVVEFDETRVVLQLEKPFVPPIVPARFKSCFSVTPDSAHFKGISWSVAVTSPSTGKERILETEANGEGCLYLPSGKYSATVVLTPETEGAGIRFAPKEQEFEVKKSPVYNLAFSQFLGEIQGQIVCLESCPLLSVSLRPAKGSAGSPRMTTSNQGKFNFKDVLPGDYLLSVDKEEWCWTEQTLSVAVNVKKLRTKFEQTGYRLTLNASHKTTLNYVTNTKNSGTLEVSQGTSRQCVSSPGKYAFTPISCHKFGSALSWDTSAPQLLSLIATHHRVTGTLKSDEDGTFVISVNSDCGKETLGPLVASAEDKRTYPFECVIKEGEEITMTPSSPSNLFQYSPTSHTFVMPKDCLLDAVTFAAERALFLKGYVKPALKGVVIKVEGGKENETYSTNADGLFIVGPLDKSAVYTVTAEKIGYVIKPPFQKLDTFHQRAGGVVKVHFEAYKLAEIIVKVTQEGVNGVAPLKGGGGGTQEGVGGDAPLKGVLISMSGGKNYRQNSLTEDDGVINFQSLMPSEYFLRPMMKEYVFEPPSKMVQVEDGGTVHVDISARRVAYSVFGQTVSLSGEAEGGVVVEAVGAEEKCAHLREEAVADAQGHFRIRGLTPKCNYKLRLSSGEGVNEHLLRAQPRESALRVEEADSFGKRITVLRAFLQMDVAVIFETENRYLSTLSVELYRDDIPDSPIHTLAVGNHPFFMLPPMRADRYSYTLHIVSSLPQNRYRYNVLQIPFKANDSFKKLTASFEPVLRSTEAEINHSTVFGLIFFLLLIFIGINYQHLQPMLEGALDLYFNSRNSVSKPVPQAASDILIEPVAVRKRTKSRKT